MAKKWLRRANAVFGLVLVAASVWFVQRELRRVDLPQVLEHLRQMSVLRAAVALGITFGGLAIICGYDWLGTRYAGVRLGVRRTVFLSFISNAFSNAISLAVIGIAGMRVHLYTDWGVGALEQTKIIGFVAVSAWVGLLTVTGVTWLLWPPELPVAVAEGVLRGVAGAMVAAVGGYVVLCAVVRELKWRGWRAPLPSWRMAVGQVLVGGSEWVTLTLVFYALLPARGQIPLVEFFPAYVGALFLAILGAMPAGLGVLDAGVLALLGEKIDRAVLISTLAMFRLVYHLPPLMVAAVMLAGHEWRKRREGGVEVRRGEQ